MIKKIFLFSVLLLIITACNKNGVTAPDFNVTTSNNATTFPVNTPVNFLFTGNPDYITFYSGETGHIYEFRDRVTAGVRTDAGVPLKNATTKMTAYSYTFIAPGTYKVTFVVSDTNIYDSKSEVKDVDITITP